MHFGLGAFTDYKDRDIMLKQEDPSPSLSAVIGHWDLCDPDNCSIDYVSSELFSLKM